jgi:hypothetical protein
MAVKIFTVIAFWDPEVNFWCGVCDDAPLAVDSPTLDELMVKAPALALDVQPDNRPGIDPRSVVMQMLIARDALDVPVAA